MIHLLRTPATPQQLDEMLETLRDYIKVAVDVDTGWIVGGGSMHADCEAVLLDAGCAQVSIWGADWYPEIRHVEFESMINVRPDQNNPGREIADPDLRSQVERLIRSRLEQEP